MAAEMASLLALPLDALCVRKVPVPGYAELAMGAVAPMGERPLPCTSISTKPPSRR